MSRLSHGRVSGGAGDAVGCWMLWASVVMQVLLEYWRAYRAARPAGAGQVVARAGRYFRSPDGRTVLSLAGLDPGESVQAALLTIVSGPTSPTQLLSDALYRTPED